MKKGKKGDSKNGARPHFSLKKVKVEKMGPGPIFSILFILSPFFKKRHPVPLFFRQVFLSERIEKVACPLF